MADPWGKRWGLPRPYLLKWHLLDTAAVAYVLWDVHLPAGVREWIGAQLGLSPEEARRFVALLAGLHDVGKACPCFQNQDPPPGTVGWIHHANVTYLTLPELLSYSGREHRIPFRSSPYRMAELLGGHHGVFQERNTGAIGRRTSRLEGKLGGPGFHQWRRELVDGLRSVLGDPTIPEHIGGPAAGVLAGFVILTDWIASDTDWIKNSQLSAPTNPTQRWSHTITSMRVRLPGLGLGVPELAGLVSIELLVSGPPNPLQESIEHDFHPTGPGLLVITAGTGSGKTEAAFVGVHRFGVATGRPGMIMCLPTQATTNAMWIRGTSFAGAAASSDRPVTLAHTMSAFFEPYRDYCADDVVMGWLNGPRKPLLAGMSVVTIDQVLLAALATRFNMLRLWGLLGKTLVVDEVHAADPYMLTLLARLLSWCGFLRVPVILISATLPRHITRELAASYLNNFDANASRAVEELSYPGWLYVGSDGTVQRPAQDSVSRMHDFGRRRTRIDYCRYQPGRRVDGILGYLESAVASGGCVAVVCSTVASAQHTFEQINAVLNSHDGSSSRKTPVWLLHARFPYQQRLQIETEVITRFGKSPTEQYPRPDLGIVVTTTILEQSLDVDFDLIISDLVPIAQLIQRLGRVWRHAVYTRPAWVMQPTLVVLDPELAGFPPEWRSIYPEYELAATRRLLAEHGPDLVVPDDVDRLVQQVHNRDLPPIDGADATAWSKRNSTALEGKSMAGFVTIPAPHLLGDLLELTNPHVAEDDVDASTRLGVDNVWLIPQYTDTDGRHWLDADHRIPFPGGSLSDSDVMTMIAASVRCPLGWVRGWDNPYRARWKKTPLVDAYLFPAPEHGGLHLDPELGLVKEGLSDAL
ncbi:CRISPR-associated helicase Cas3' [Nocardia rhizosphaerihabitans]|uniref:CRISPR-associated helicase Cas3' n=1 Tax=Nocardia rhizosphaerihabitans TaxID=1691570 RepID=UPI001667FAA6|nr:CRISPR-associated helicase Cas3' [Nocardia rhizosphaerihabitans]